MQGHAQCTGHFEDCGKVRAAFTGQCPVQAFARQTRITRHFTHALRARDIAQRLGDESRIAVAFNDASIEIRRHLVRCTQVLGHIEGLQARFLVHCHGIFTPNHSGLKNHHFASTLCVIQVSMIAWIAICEAANPGKDPHPSDHVFQVVDPVFEFLGAFHIHADNCCPPTTVHQSALGPIRFTRAVNTVRYAEYAPLLLA